MEKLLLTNGDKIDVVSRDIEQCIKITGNFTNTIYTNICDGSINIVEMGFRDYLANIGLFLIMFLLLSLIIYKFIINEL